MEPMRHSSNIPVDYVELEDGLSFTGAERIQSAEIRKVIDEEAL